MLIQGIITNNFSLSRDLGAVSEKMSFIYQECNNSLNISNNLGLNAFIIGFMPYCK